MSSTARKSPARPTDAALSSARAMVLVIDRHISQDKLAQLRTQKDGIGPGIESWLETGFEYLLIAGTDEHARAGRLRAIMARTPETLSEASSAACKEVAGTQCAWVFLCAAETQDFVTKVALSHAIVEGSC